MSDPDATEPLTDTGSRGGSPVGARIGRYVVLASLGAGGGGEVFAAYDPQLDRKVAVKRLRAGSDTELLVREARMLAKLRHPAVVTVYDVGVEEDEAHLAMELVEGDDLGRWLEAHPEASGSQRLAMLRDAAAGLRAAHQAGIVHGDVKPANILVGSDGSVLVGDFGVARLLRATDARARVVGTPLYMAPEQHAGLPADVCSDVFSFAVTAWQVLTGVHPFADAVGPAVTPASGTSAADLGDPNSASGAAGLLAIAEAKRKGPPALPDPLPELPGARAVFEAIRRGLQPDPDARPESLGELIEAMTPKAPTRWWVPVLALCTVGAAAGLVLGGRSKDARCSGGDARLAEVWGPARAEALARRWTRLGAPWSSQVRPLTETLDGYARRWVAAHRDNCEATAILAEQSQADADLRNRCLLDARAALDASASLLEQADVQTARRADDLVNALPDLHRCASVSAIEAQTRVPDADDLRDDVDAVRDALPAARAELLAGRFAQAREAIAPLVERAEALAYPPLRVELAPAWADALDRTADTTKAYDIWRVCVREGLEHGLFVPAFHCATGMAEALAQRDAKFELSAAWITVAQGLAGRPGMPETATGELMRARASLAYESADYARAVEIDRALLERRITAFGSRDRRVGIAMVSLSNAQHRAGDLESAEKTIVRAREILEATLGPDHPITATAVLDLGTVLEARGANDEALAAMREAERILAAALGPEHEELSMVHTNIAISLTALGQFDDALAEYREGLAIIEGHHGPGHVEAGRIKMNMGVVAMRQMDYPRARQILREALDILEATLPERHEHRVSCTMNLALAIASLGDTAQARPLLEDVLEARVATLSPTHPSIAGIRGNLGHMLLELGEAEKAKAQFEAALEVRAANPSRPKDRAFETLGLGRALYALGKAEEGKACAREAIELWREAGPGYDSYREEAEAWLADVG